MIRQSRVHGVKFDAIFALEDFTAMGAMQAVKELGIKVPDEIGIIGFANESFGSLVSPTLSTIDQQTSKMGEETARLFISQLKSGTKDIIPQKLTLEPVLVVRESSERIK